jgi:ribosomal protein S18 acetylase RimI-like enzyme
LKIEYTETDGQRLDLIKDLWEKLNALHKSRSRHYAAHFEGMTFNRRKDDLIKKSADGFLHIGLARDTGTRKLIGYCITSINARKQGEIESIYVEPNYRRQRIGDTLMKKALKWLDGSPVTTRTLVVAAGNEEVIDFYSRYGFYPRVIILEQPRPD